MRGRRTENEDGLTPDGAANVSEPVVPADGFPRIKSKMSWRTAGLWIEGAFDSHDLVYQLSVFSGHLLIVGAPVYFASFLVIRSPKSATYNDRWATTFTRSLFDTTPGASAGTQAWLSDS